ncbi:MULTISPECIES: GNAT family N-acetyltransferase [Streptomyces]|uniref:GNAT family N-acetyltransferase n=1 Tax=Streptomyces xanthii TaxID=2768069 RepID=A0A7H1B8G6_9ACTN|nr:GNAT family N-acetyltransferase [Streptomyces xanthii]QNS05021.1 GNAT family N-acetyltransferase [Streptomyces xanthii]
MTTRPGPAETVRPITPEEVRTWSRALNTGFVRSPTVSDETVDRRRAQFDLSRVRGAFTDTGRAVATFRSFAQTLTVPGGATVPTDAITNVTVTPTHRRRGLLTRMMADDLAEAKERGDVAATLIAAEYPIYGRYGFGPATTATTWEIDVPRTGLGPRWSAPEDGATIELVDAAEYRKEGPGLHDRLRTRVAGMVSREPSWWDRDTGLAAAPEEPWTEPFFALYRSARGEVEGLLRYRIEGKFSDAVQPVCTATVLDLFGETPAAERALWHYVCAIDWVTVVRSGLRAPDDLLPDLLPDPRAARIVRQSDAMWVRLLDVAAALEARSYGTSGALVIEVRDEAGLAGGRFAWDAAPDGATCVPSAAAPQLTLGVAELGALWLGEVSAVRLAALGRVVEEEAGAAAVADALLRTSRRPWCPDMF